MVARVVIVHVVPKIVLKDRAECIVPIFEPAMACVDEMHDVFEQRTLVPSALAHYVVLKQPTRVKGYLADNSRLPVYGGRWKVGVSAAEWVQGEQFDIESVRSVRNRRGSVPFLAEKRFGRNTLREK